MDPMPAVERASDRVEVASKEWQPIALPSI